ncbi:Isopentenyldiphosphate isomerase [Rubrobacter radiotolerans DSM 5868]|nr:Isopentenyldiphosphate isomerase [Rubrobacter radiotolerans DSM 5868]
MDILDERGEKTGETRLKSEAHRDGLWHRCFHCWIVRPGPPGKEAEEATLLLQRRASVKDTWPGLLDVSVGGHLSSGESPLDGRREIHEELGLSVGPERLIPLGERRVERRIPQGTDREFHEVFLLLDGTHPLDLRLQPEEVDSVVEVRLRDAARLAAGESVPATEHRVAAGESRERSISLNDFVAGDGEYLAGVVRAAEATLRNAPPEG